MGSLRIMHFGFMITVIVAVLIIGTSQVAIAQTEGVECPCDFESVPKTTGCWVEQRLGGSPEYVDRSETSKVCFVRNIINEPFVIPTWPSVKVAQRTNSHHSVELSYSTWMIATRRTSICSK